MIKEILILVIMALAFPLGYLLAYLCRDELQNGRRWFLILSSSCLVFGLIFIFFNLEASLTLFFISMVSFVSFLKSYNLNFVKS